jgi:hypothetical protein
MSTVNEMTFNLGGKQINLSKTDFNNAKKGFFDPNSVEGKKIKMAMTVDASADYATNAQEYFRKAMIGEEKTRGKFRQLLGVKDRVNLGTADVSTVVIKAGACDFNPNDTAISQKVFEVKPLMYGTVFCVKSLEESFVSDQLARGSNDFNQQFAFMNFFFEQLALNIEQQMETVTFKGTVAANGVDGLEVKLTADAAVLKPTAGNGGVASAVTDLNVIDKLKQARNVLRTANPAVLDKEDFVYIVSGNVYDALADAVSDNKASGLYYIEKETLAFQGMPIYKARGASDNVIIATYWSNLVNIQDLLDEELGFNIVDFIRTTLDRKIGVRVDFKFQPDYVIPAEIYFHKF